MDIDVKDDKLLRVLARIKEMGECILMEKDNGKVVGIIELKYYDPEEWGKKTIDDSQNENSERNQL